MRIDERLTQEKQKVSALDFDDLELRALDLLSRPEVMTRATERYKFFLVDEFQDTNDLQRKLLERLALQGSRRESANLFIVGDRKQSIYGFRGADVDVFREMTTTLLTAGGENMPLLLNFRSQPQLISFFNRLFSRLFVPSEEIDKQELMELGYVAHEPGEAKREVSEREPLIEVMITTEAADENDIKAQQTSRERDAEQLSTRIRTIVDAGRFNYSDIALLFRAMTHVQTYESAFRRANIPYQTVLGRGFYQREEITDLIQLLRFLDNKTDELALAAVLRSPLCGISDNGLLALRCAPWLDEVNAEDRAAHFTKTRALYMALLRHRDIAFISDEEHELLERAAILIKGLIARRHHYSIGALLRYAVEQTEYSTVIAATFDGAQRLANVQRLFTLAERFERSGDYLIRDFVRYVEEFEAIGSRESEGQIDEATNAVRLMTIHQAKGLEFPVVIIPDLQRLSRMQDNWVILDRHRGLTLKVPDGRGKLVAGCTFNKLEQRHEWREQFESMRLLYVAATRARERLILSGTTKDLNNLGLKNDTWLNWIWQALEWPVPSGNNVVELQDNTQVQITLNLAAQTEAGENLTQLDETVPAIGENAASLYEAFPLLRTIQSESGGAVHRFSVTQLLNYQRCPRQYYFDRVLHAPADDALAVWNNAEAPEPPANLTATLKGAVIHRFCETYSTGDPLEDRLSRSFDDVLRSRQAELADRLNEINREQAIAELLPLARNYLSSAVFARVERAQRFAGAAGGISDLKVISPFAALHSGPGLWSELGFRLRRPLGIITGAIDKLLVTPTNDGLQIEIIDFKTNRLREKSLPEAPLPEIQNSSMGSRSDLAGKRRRSAKPPLEQIAFDFNALSGSTKHVKHLISDLPSEDRVRALATDYELQMQAYALAVNELITPASKAPVFVTSTLHFLDPNVEFHLPENLMTADACIAALDDAMMQIASSLKPGDFPVRPAVHCRMCNFHSICAAGREWLRASRTAATNERAGEYRVAEAGR
jgi:ATP-dependent helicase/nuclease subunit A